MGLHLRLYVAGRSGASLRAIRNLEGILKPLPATSYQLDVVDVLEHVDLAERDRVLATPTLIRLQPRPVRKLVGDLSDRRKTVLALDLDQLGVDERTQE